jgi:hypothetical protein
VKATSEVILNVTSETLIVLFLEQELQAADIFNLLLDGE